MSEQLAINLYRLMAKKKWDIATLAKEAGLNPVTVSRILNGKIKRSAPETIGKIAEALEVEIEELL